MDGVRKNLSLLLRASIIQRCRLRSFPHNKNHSLMVYRFWRRLKLEIPGFPQSVLNLARLWRLSSFNPYHVACGQQHQWYSQGYEKPELSRNDEMGNDLWCICLLRLYQAGAEDGLSPNKYQSVIFVMYWYSSGMTYSNQCSREVQSTKDRESLECSAVFSALLRKSY